MPIFVSNLQWLNGDPKISRVGTTSTAGCANSIHFAVWPDPGACLGRTALAAAEARTAGGWSYATTADTFAPPTGPGCRTRWPRMPGAVFETRHVLPCATAASLAHL